MELCTADTAEQLRRVCVALAEEKGAMHCRRHAKDMTVRHHIFATIAEDASSEQRHSVLINITRTRNATQ